MNLLGPPRNGDATNDHELGRRRTGSAGQLRVTTTYAGATHPYVAGTEEVEHVFSAAEEARISRAVQQARDRHVTVVASSGDGGAASDQGLPRQVSLPASDPLVLAVGGTSLNASYQTGAYHGEMGWNELTNATGGGYSRLFRRPGYQDGIARSAAYHRAFHDVLTGDNSVFLPAGTLTGYQAGPGWDPVTGWGSPDAQVLVPLLAARSDAP
jgi:kumamolisin